ncbi:MAG: hypothetical protein E2O80_03935 [Betaproteobacteria bacterium]|nr:MAG: hypothetical protein E2O80_03935 [Betaproteobacteria bacterium]
MAIIGRDTEKLSHWLRTASRINNDDPARMICRDLEILSACLGVLCLFIDAHRRTEGLPRSVE